MQRTTKTSTIGNGAIPKQRNNENRHNKAKNGSNATIRPTAFGNTKRAPLTQISRPKNDGNNRPMTSKSEPQQFAIKTKVTKSITTKATTVPQKTQPFVVLHDDDDEETAKVTSTSAENEAISDKSDIENDPISAEIPSSSTDRNGNDKSVIRHPLATLDTNNHGLKDSPMLIDLSDTPESEEEVSEIRHDEPAEADPTSEQISFLCYSEEIYSYLRELETRTRPKPNYMRKQPDVTPGMRSILVDWLVEVADEYRLNIETFYLAVSYIDRFLSCMSVVRDKLQLVGTACMFLAAKFEEIYPPEVDEFVYITDDTYTKKQVVRMEQIVLRVLAFDLAIPTVNQFLQRFIHAFDLDVETQHLASYLCELTQLEVDPFLRFLPSIIASAGVSLACHTLSKQAWTEEMISYTGYTIADFNECMFLMHKSYCNAPSYGQQAIREKYSNSKFNAVAQITPPEMIPS